MKKLLLSLLLSLLVPAFALAQGPSPGPGPSPSPGPWVQNGAIISYSNGSVVVPATVAGGAKGTGTINATALYVGGVAVATTAGSVASFSAGTTGLTPSTATTGAVSLSGVLIGANGGTGVANTGKTITLGGNLTTSGAFAGTFTFTGTTSVTFPTSGTLATTSSISTALPSATSSQLYVGSGSAGAAAVASVLPTAAMPALTGDVTNTAGSLATTLATVNSNVGSFGSSTAIPIVTVNGKGLVTAASTAVVIAPAGTLTGTTLAANVVSSSLTSLGTIGTGVWQGTVVGATYGGTGINNGSSTLTMAGSHTLSGAFTSAFTFTGTTAVTFPTSGTLATTATANVITVSNSDGTLTISPTSGAVVASLALSHANTWAGQQTFVAPILGVATGTSLQVTGIGIGTTAATNPQLRVQGVGTGTNFSLYLTDSGASNTIITAQDNGNVTFGGGANGTIATLTGSTKIAAFTTGVTVGGASIGSDAVAITGSATISGALTAGTGTFTGAVLNLGPSSSAEVDIQTRGTAPFAAIALGSYWDAYVGGNSGVNRMLRITAANLKIGATDAAAPVAQTISVQNVIAGTSNTAGVNTTLAMSQGSGTGIGGSFIVQVAPAGSTGTAVNALATALTIDSTKLATFAGAMTVASTITTTNGHIIASAGTLIGDAVKFNTNRGFISVIADGVFKLTKDDGTTGAVISVTTADTFKFRNLANTLDASITAGTVTLNGANVRGNALALTDSSDTAYAFVNRSGTTDGRIVLYNGAASGFDMLQFGGTASTFPAIKRSSAAVAFRLADDSADTAISATTATWTNVASDAASTDNSLCLTTSTGVMTKGSGTLGICLGTSSLRYKERVTEMADGLAAINALSAKNFYYKKGWGDNGARMQYGFIAEDVVKVLPKLVGLNEKSEPNTVDILGMTPVMIKAIQQLTARVAKLEAQQ